MGGAEQGRAQIIPISKEIYLNLRLLVHLNSVLIAWVGLILSSPLQRPALDPLGLKCR